MSQDNFQDGWQEIHFYEISVLTFHHPQKKIGSKKYFVSLNSSTSEVTSGAPDGRS